MNEKGTKNDMYWYVMVQEEAQDQKNDSDVLYIYLVENIACYWKHNNGILMLRITGLNGLGEDLIKAEYVKVYYPDTLALYLIGMSIGVKNTGRTATFGRISIGGVGL